MQTTLSINHTAEIGYGRQGKQRHWLAPVLIVTLLVLVLIPGCALPRAAAPSNWPTQGWHSTTPEQQGIDSVKLAEALLAIRQHNLNLHSLLLVRNGLVVVDASFYPYDGKAVHDVASVTKSVMTTLIAIAADQGKLDLDAPLVSFFPERTIANRDARKERITVRHLASMANGLESQCLANDEGTLKAMQESPDWVQFALDRKMTYEPGTHFCYDSPGMHLLSAILQQATGLTTLDFARQNLFAPLGIHDVIWPMDAQGFNHGWGDLHLLPRDMAKFGYLWLNHGLWEGKQLVSRSWVDESVTTQMTTGGDDDYGYGWWVMTGEEGVYAAIGRGGQRIQVWQPWQLMLVMTGGGVEVDDIEPFVAPALVDTSKPLAANPAGVAQLDAALAAIVQPPAPTAVAPLPAAAKVISGKTFVFEPNPLGIETVALEFSDSAEAILHIKLAGNDQIAAWPVGLDGVYRLSTGNYNLPQGLRGDWTDAQTFAFEYDNIANNDHIFLRLHIEDDHVVLESQETAHELGARFEGKLQGE